jgi:hypothetical protein
MGMTIEEIAAVCWQRSGDEAEQDRAQAYWYIARHLEDRPAHTLVQLAADLELWRDAQAQHAERVPAESWQYWLSTHQAAVYKEVLAWARGEKSVDVQKMNSEGENSVF